jgi:hypothetical protein
MYLNQNPSPTLHRIPGKPNNPHRKAWKKKIPRKPYLPQPYLYNPGCPALPLISSRILYKH